MPYARPIILLVSPVFIAIAWLLCASEVWSTGTDSPYSAWAWWDALEWWEDDWWVTLWIALGAFIPTIFVALFVAGTVQWLRLRGRVQRRMTGSGTQVSIWRRPRRDALPEIIPAAPALTDNHGHSFWRTMQDVQKRFDGPVAPHGGIAAGEAYRVDYDRSVAGIEFDPRNKATWGLGGKAPLLVDSCLKGARAFHSCEFAPTGGGKTAELVTKILVWTGSSVVFDPTVELGPLLDKALRHRRNRVFHVGLANPSKPIRMTGYNVLSWIDPTHQEAELHLNGVAATIYDEAAGEKDSRTEARSSDPFFGPMGRRVVRCLLAHLVWQDPDKIEISLATFVALISIPEDDMIALLHSIQARSPSPMARRLAGTIMGNRAPETFSGIYLNATVGVDWLISASVYADLLSVGEFDPRCLLLGNCTTFLNIDERTIKLAPVIPRVIFNGILNTIFMADGHSHGLTALYVDEADALRYFQPFQTVRDRGRHFKIVLHMLWQSIGQMRDIWGNEQTRAWMDAFSWVGFSGIRAASAGKDLSTELGSHGVLAYSEGVNQGQQQPFGLSFGTFSRGQNVNTHEIKRALITASEMQQDLRADEKIIVPDTGLPIRCGRCLWFRREEFVEMVGQ